MDRERRSSPSSPGALESRFPFLDAQVVVLVAIALDFSLPSRLTVGPVWLLPSVEAALLVGLVATTPSMHATHPVGRRHLALAMIGMVSAVNAVSLALLVHYLVSGHKETGRSLIAAGAVLWLTNVLLFGLWYWELDRGGPVERDRGGGPPDFLFPQMATPQATQPNWVPGLIDYLYVSFTNATAFSPTDTMPLTAVAKSVMTFQSLVSLITIGLVVARAVNILT